MIPLSFAQQRLWIIGQLAGPSTAYNMPLVLRLSGVLDRQALAAALGDVVGRHESLRTVFPVVDGEPVQQIVPADEVTVPLAWTDTDDEQVTDLAVQAAGHVFDLAGAGDAVAGLEMPPILKARFAACAHDRVADGKAHAVLLGQQTVAGAIAPIHEEVRFFYISQLSGEHVFFPAGRDPVENANKAAGMHAGVP